MEHEEQKKGKKKKKFLEYGIIKFQEDYMQAIREIRKVDTRTITVKVPDEFIGQYVEIVVLPYDEPDAEELAQRY